MKANMFDQLFENLKAVGEAKGISMSFVERQMKDYYARKPRYSHLDFGTHNEVRFWILSDGTVIRVWQTTHAETAADVGIDYSELFEAGALRGYSVKKSGEIGVEGVIELTSAQKSSFLMLSRRYLSREVHLDSPGNHYHGPIKNLEYVLEYGAKSLAEAKAADDKEKMDYFLKRMHLHIGLVQAAAAKIAEAYPEEFGELVKQTADHDASKLKDPEMTPYVAITWRHKLEKEEGEFDPIKGKGYQMPGKLEKREEDDATLHHIKNNTHHPEYWLDDKVKIDLGNTNRDDDIKCVDATKMDAISIAEMVADWQAMSEELQTNTAREWFDSVENKRWHFSDEQKELIDRLLKVFEESDIVEEARNSHSKCMKCSSAPEVEVLWAEGMGHAWFCMKDFKEWATKGDGQGDVCSVKKIQDGEASKKWKDNTSSNIINSMKFL